jgi:predicted RNA methylase
MKSNLTLQGRYQEIENPDINLLKTRWTDSEEILIWQTLRKAFDAGNLQLKENFGFPYTSSTIAGVWNTNSEYIENGFSFSGVALTEQNEAVAIFSNLEDDSQEMWLNLCHMIEPLSELQKVLKKCVVEGNNVVLPQGQLNRKNYEEVKKALNNIGGKWKGGKTQAFVFEYDPTKLLAEIAGGQKRNLKKEFQFFETPETLANQLVYLADVQQHDTILEPSAGRGAIIWAINKVCGVQVDCYELMPENVELLKKTDLCFNFLGNDFFNNTGKTYSKIIANPPFTNNQDIIHLQEMYKYLRRGGRLVCITSASWVNGNQNKQINFRQWLEDVNAEILDIESGTFKESGTTVGGKIVVINKPL